MNNRSCWCFSPVTKWRCHQTAQGDVRARCMAGPWLILCHRPWWPHVPVSPDPVSCPGASLCVSLVLDEAHQTWTSTDRGPQASLPVRLAWQQIKTIRTWQHRVVVEWWGGDFNVFSCFMFTKNRRPCFAGRPRLDALLRFSSFSLNVLVCDNANYVRHKLSLCLLCTSLTVKNSNFKFICFRQWRRNDRFCPTDRFNRDWPMWIFWGRCRYIGHSWTDTDISKIFKSCFLLHYQKYNVFYALPFFKNFKNQDLWAEIFQIAAI